MAQVIAWLIARTGLSRLAIGLITAAIVIAAVLWLRHDAYRDGVRATDAKWQAAALVLAKRANAAQARADEAERVRDETHMRNMQELRDAAAKGDSSVCGPGTSAVLDRLRNNAHR